MKSVTRLAVLLELTAPLSEDPSVRFSVAELTLSASTAPTSTCLTASIVAVPPLDPAVPQLPAAAVRAVRRKRPST